MADEEERFTGCDFCGCDDHSISFAAQSFIVPLLNGYAMLSNGAWQSCDICAEFVRRRDWDGLTNRVLAIFEDRHGKSLEHYKTLWGVIREQYRLLDAAISEIN